MRTKIVTSLFIVNKLNWFYLLSKMHEKLAPALCVVIAKVFDGCYLNCNALCYLLLLCLLLLCLLLLGKYLTVVS